MRRTNLVPASDVVFSAGDFDAAADGDLVWTEDPSVLLTQAVLDFLESSPNSMPYVMPGWGYKGRDDDLSVADDRIRSRAEMFVEKDLLRSRNVVPLYKEILRVNYTFYSGSNKFRFQVVARLDDLAETDYDETFEWDGDLLQAQVI